MTNKIKEKIDQNKDIVSMSTTEVARYTKHTVKYIYKLVHQREIPAHKSPKGGMLRFEKSEIDEWMFSQTLLTKAQIAESTTESIFSNLSNIVASLGKNRLHQDIEGLNKLASKLS